MVLGIVVLRALPRIHALRVRLEQAYNDLIGSVSKGVGEWSNEQDKIQALELENKTLKSKVYSLQSKYDDLKLRIDKLDK